MILIINDELKIQGKPDECIEFLKKYRETFKEENPTKLETDLSLWAHTLKSTSMPGVIYTNNGCEGCLYYQQRLLHPELNTAAGDTPCTWCKKMQPYCTCK